MMRQMAVQSSALTLTNPSGLYDPAPNGYSHVASVAAGARLVFIAGQGGETADGKLADDFRLQVRQALRNLGIAVTAAGARHSDIAKLTVLIVDHSEERLHVFGEELTAALGAGAEAHLHTDSGTAPSARWHAVRGRSGRRAARVR